MIRTIRPLMIVAASALLLAACDKKAAPAPPAPVVEAVNITTARVLTRDLPVVESAVGAETSLSLSESIDPTRVSRRPRTVRLPFPEQVARKLKIGQAVTLSSFGAPERTARGRITDIHPALNSTTDSLEVIAEILDPGWQPRGSVRGEVVLGVHPQAMLVPEQAIVLRPAGVTVYVIEGDVAKARDVTTGMVRAGSIEILKGLKPNELVAVDGANELSDNAKVAVRGATP